MQVYLCESPRALFLFNSEERSRTHSPLALVLRSHQSAKHGGTQNGSSQSSYSLNASRAIIETIPVADIPELNSLKKLHGNVHGCLGLINVGNDLFVAIVQSAKEVGAIRPGEVVMRITSVAFHCLNKSIWDDYVIEDSVGNGMDPLDQSFPDGSHSPIPTTGPVGLIEHPCYSLKKLLSTGTFYFALNGAFDISQRLSKRSEYPAKGRRRAPLPPKLQMEQTASPAQNTDQWNYDPRFVWNTYMMDPLQEYRSKLDPSERNAFDGEGLLTLAMQGFVGNVQIGNASIALISRLSWKRAGTRYNTRGIDDDGNVANFAESETLFSFPGKTMSYCQIRGSVPLFWEQQGIQAFNARIQITRSRAASQPAFDRHFTELLEHYKHIHALNLLGNRDAETVLTSAFAEHMRNSDAENIYLGTLSKEDGIEQAEAEHIDRIGLTNFDFHTINRLNGGLDGVKHNLRRLEAVQLKRHSFGFTLVDEHNEAIQSQQGVFRTNCLDCLDRTNVIQDILSQDAVQLCVDGFNEANLGNTLWTNHRILWAENGDALSRIYAGTGALNTSLTRTGGGKKTLGGFLSDAAKSASRLYINNFQDKSKQNVIDALLGNMANQKPVSVFDPLHDAVNAELNERLEEYSTGKSVTVFTGTWNLAGKGPIGENLMPFLFATNSEPDIIAIGLQEVVPLTPQQVLLTDPDKLRLWESILMEAISKRKDAKARYIPLRSEQLVGTALVVVIKDTLLPYVRQVEAATKKTGLRGMSGNKGGVAIRMNIYDTSFCFVTAHFAAGKANVEERNADFATISRGLSFFSGRNISSCSHIFWFGDFNYRIDGTNEVVRPLCDGQDFGALSQRDQLLRSMSANQTFVGYKEATISFLPTYKYDFHSQVYDTSEKMRVPAWTDRILSKSQYPLTSAIRVYNRAELLTSDHRPVYALFTCEARQFDSEKRNSLRRQLLSKYKAAQVENGALLHDYSSDSTSSGEYSTEHLPEPSGGKSNWWDYPLSDGEESDDDQQSAMDANPFSSSSPLAQKASSSSFQVTSSAPSTRNVSPMGVSSTIDSRNLASAQSKHTTRRPPPEPPKRGPIHTVPNTDGGGPSPNLGENILPTSVQSSENADIRPQIPARPKLGSRSQSYQSQRSLLDDSD